MSERRAVAASQPEAQDAAAPSLARIDALRQAGAWRLDPARFRYLEALSRRMSTQPEPVRRLLQDKLDAALGDYAARFAQAQASAAEVADRLLARQPRLAAQLRLLQAVGDFRAVHRLAAPQRSAARCAPLAELNAHAREAVASRVAAAAPGEAQEDELASVRRFRQAWSSTRTRDQVEQAVARKSANAGPLNSHALVLQSLALMDELSPAYLRRFIVLVESLQWLEQAGEKVRPQPGKVARPARRRSARKA